MSIVEKHSKPLIAITLIVYVIFALKITNGSAYWNDAAWFSAWQHLVRAKGLLGAYIESNTLAKQAHLMPINYPPLYLYLLRFMPVPAIALGLISVVPVLCLVWKKFGIYNTFLILAMPVSFYNVLFVGQIDYLFLFLLIMSLHYYNNQPVASGVLAGLCLLLKDEAIIFLPIFLVMGIRNKRFLAATILTWSVFFLPFYSHIFTVLKVSYLNNLNVFDKMGFTAGNIWALFTGTVNKARTGTYDFIAYFLSAAWAAYIFVYALRTRQFMAACYYASIGFIFFPDHSNYRDFIYPFFLAFFLYNMGQEKFKNSAYFFGIGLVINIIAFGVDNPLVMLISVKIVALVNLFIVVSIIKDIAATNSYTEGSPRLPETNSSPSATPVRPEFAVKALR